MATRPTPIIASVRSRRHDAAPGGLQPEHQAGERDAAQHQADAVEAAARRLAHVLDEQADQDDAEHADRHVDVEDPAPGEIGDDEAADRRARAPGPSSAGTVSQAIAATSSCFAAVRSSTSRPTGTIIAPPMPCRTRAATRNAERIGAAAQDRADGEHRDRGAEHRARAVAVGDPAAGRDEHREADSR